MDIYIPGMGGGYRSLISQPQVPIPRTSQISKFEHQYLSSIGIAPHFCDRINGHSIECYAYDEITQNQLFSLVEMHEPSINLLGDRLDITEFKRLVSISESMRDKGEFYKLVKSYSPNLALTESQTFSNYSELKLSLGVIVKKIGYPLIIKSTCGKGGKGNLVCFDHADLEMALKIIESPLFANKTEYGHSPLGSAFIVEKFYAGTKAFNSTFLINGNDKNVHYTSEQIIDEVFYRGNRSCDSISNLALCKISNFNHFFREYALNKLGYRGWVGIDYILLPDDRIIPIEVNPRINSITHSYLLSKDKPFELFLCRYVGNQEFSGNLIKSTLDNIKSAGNIYPYQISRADSIMFLAVADTYTQVKKLKSDLIGSNEFSSVQQSSVGGHSLSISYYLER